MIDPKSKDVCFSDDHAEECLQYIAGKAWREERRLRGLTEKCPFATNQRCGRLWEWWCKGSNYPFLLTTFEVKEGTHDLPVRDENGDIKFTYDEEMVNHTCLGGDPAVYMECPNYKVGVKFREYYKSLNREKNDK